MVSVRKSGKHVTNSPFKILVGPSEIGDASKVRVWGKGLSEGQTFQVSEFIVDTRNAGTSHPKTPMELALQGFLSLFPVHDLPPLATSSSPASWTCWDSVWSPLGKSERPQSVSSVTAQRKLSYPELVSPHPLGSKKSSVWNFPECLFSRP